MKQFSTKEEALNYAKENIEKYDYEVVNIGIRPTFLSATSLPLEEKLRNPIEEMVISFLTDMGMDERKAEDVATYIGAETCSKIIDMITVWTPFDIECAYQEF